MTSTSSNKTKNKNKINRGIRLYSETWSQIRYIVDTNDDIKSQNIAIERAVQLLFDKTNSNSNSNSTISTSAPAQAALD